jgi:manganese/zinc/iron transport system permease protein
MSAAAVPSSQPSRLSSSRDARRLAGLCTYLAVGLLLGGAWIYRQAAVQAGSAHLVTWDDFRLPLWTIVIGMATNASCSILGCYLVLRRMSLLGDAISHAVLPGIAIAFMFSGNISGVPILLGAMALGVLTSILTQSIASLGKVSEDTSMGVVFTSLFALGVILIQAFGSRTDLDPSCVLYGQIDYAAYDTANLAGYEVPESLSLLVPALVVTLLFVLLLWNELKIVSFDPALAAAMGLPVIAIHYALVAMVAGVSVSAFWSVGSILVVAMLIVPATAAALLADRLAWMMVWALSIGAVAAVLGYAAAAQWETNVAGMMAVAAGLQLVLAVFFAPRNGLVSRWLRNQSLAVRIASEDVLGRLYRAEERLRGETSAVGAHNSEIGGISPWTSLLARWRLARQGWIESNRGGSPQLTNSGRQAARNLVRAHRLWETYLDAHFDLPRDHLHDAAERMEHFLDPQLQAELDAELAGRAVDPHGKSIPPRDAG